MYIGPLHMDTNDNDKSNFEIPDMFLVEIIQNFSSKTCLGCLLCLLLVSVFHGLQSKIQVASYFGLILQGVT